jgi:hypothetical protein
MRRTHALAATSIAVLLVTSLVSCAPTDRESLIDPEPTSTAPGPVPTAAPSFDPTLSAEVNLAYFDSVNEALIEKEQDAGRVVRRGKKFVDALVAAGFPKANMEVTPDRTAIGLDADSVVFSVAVGTDCLVGQIGIEGYDSTIAPLLGSGKCLVGVTRTIDW